MKILFSLFRGKKPRPVGAAFADKLKQS